MAAPEGNKFWKLRSKHGRDRLFATPELLWEAACEYFEWVDSNPLKVVDFKGKDVVRVEIEKMRPYTILGLCLFLGVNRNYLSDLSDSIDEKTEEGQGFSDIITRVRDVIYTQKFEGAAAGLFNANIIARDLGLRDKKELTGDILFPIGAGVVRKKK